MLCNYRDDQHDLSVLFLFHFDKTLLNYWGKCTRIMWNYAQEELKTSSKHGRVETHDGGVYI